MKNKVSVELTPEQQTIINSLPAKDISAIAAVIRRDWRNVYFGARPYLEAMFCLSTVNDMYGADSGKSIVSYFLANAGTWKGPIAKAVKTELKKRVE